MTSLRYVATSTLTTRKPGCPVWRTRRLCTRSSAQGGRTRLVRIASGLTIAIASASNDTLVGVLHLDRAGQTLFVSYGVAPDQRRTGIATRAMSLLRSWAHESGFKRIELEIGDDNRASQALARRCGFVSTGTTRSQVTEEGKLWRATTWALEP